MKKIFIFLFSTIFALNNYAQNLSVDLSVDKNPVSIDDRLTLTFNIKNATEGSIDFNPPKNFKILSGPNQSQSMSFVNGKRENSTSISYVLKPFKKGTFKIQPAKLITTNKEYITKSITVEVSNKKSKTTQQKNNKVFLKTSISKKVVFIGESVLIEYKLYSRINGVNLESAKFPDINGVWSEELEGGKNGYPTKTEKINGVLHNVFTLKRELIYPQTTGVIKIGPAKLNLIIGRSFFEAGKQLEIYSSERIINVTPLPKPKPQNFINIVGDLNITGNINHTTLKNNESLNYDIKISGKGNLKLINEIPFNVPLDFEIYDPNITKKIKIKASGMYGSKTFQYVIVPRFPGNYTIPKIQFSYFNTSSKKYETLTLKAQKITVNENENYKAVNIIQNDSTTIVTNKSLKENVNQLNNDIKHINLKLGNNQYVTRNNFVSINKIIASYILFILLVIISFYIKKNSSKLFNRKKDDYKLITLQLEKLSLESNNNNSSSSINKLLEDYFIKCLNISKEKLNNESIFNSLSCKGVSSNLINSLLQCKSDFEMMQYASVSNEKIKELVNKIVDIIKDIHKQL